MRLFIALARGVLPLIALGCGGDMFTSGPPADAGDGGSGGRTDSGGDTSSAETSDTFCAANPNHLLCADFDEGAFPSPFGYTTSASSTLSTPKVAGDTTDYFSAPESAEAQIPLLIKGEWAQSLLSAAVTSKDAAGSQLRLALELEIGADCMSTDGTTVARVVVGAYGLSIKVLAGPATQLVESSYAPDGGVSSLIAAHTVDAAPSAWVQLVLGVDLALKTATLTIGATVSSIALEGASAETAASASIFVGAEASAVTAGALACRVHADDVVFDINP
ncbi:MAG: hypothetical protein ABSC94_04490 [Polyangiaceae bacterium]